MKDLGDARELARTMVELGNDAGVRTSALITGMDTPLGLTAGNALEVRESVEVLAGGGPSDVVELTWSWLGRCCQRLGSTVSTPPTNWPTARQWTGGAR